MVDALPVTATDVASLAMSTASLDGVAAWRLPRGSHKGFLSLWLCDATATNERPCDATAEVESPLEVRDSFPAAVRGEDGEAGPSMDETEPPQEGGEALSIWSCYEIEKKSLWAAGNLLRRMLAESIETDITISTCNGSISAHRAVLSTRSPVFRSMFSHSLKEKELSAVTISDMSFESCLVMLNYIYGNFDAQQFLAHRLPLLWASDKYDIADLKEACHQSLLEDIDATNVLERLQAAHLFSLQDLKAGCLKFLVNFGKICENRDQINEFLKGADRELIAEIFQQILTAWRSF